MQFSTPPCFLVNQKTFFFHCHKSATKGDAEYFFSGRHNNCVAAGLRSNRWLILSFLLLMDMVDENVFLSNFRTFLVINQMHVLLCVHVQSVCLSSLMRTNGLHEDRKVTQMHECANISTYIYAV